MTESKNCILNRVFTRNTINDLIENSFSRAFSFAAKKYIDSIEGKSNKDVFEYLYEKLNHAYRNEYYYKNILLNKLLLGVHSMNTTVALSEIPIASSKADFILINGKATVFEIKTELDSIYRLETQISDYYKAFNRVVVVTSYSNLKAVEDKLKNTNAGIRVLNRNNVISVVKKESEHFSDLDHKVMFKVLRKNEFENIILEEYNILPDVSQFEYYKECFGLFSEIPIEEAYRCFLRQLKTRNIANKASFNNVPYELKSLLYFASINNEGYERLNKYLNEGFGG